LDQGLIWVEVKAAGDTRPLRFLFDSGAEVSVLHLDTARRLHLPLGTQVRVRGVQASRVGYWPQKLSASMSGIQLPENFLVLDLTQLSVACQTTIDGLIGADFFKDRIVRIDFRAGLIQLLGRNEPDATSESLPMELRNGAMRVQATVNNMKPAWFRVDTGCASPVQWVTRQSSLQKSASKISIGLAELAVPQTRTTIRLGSRTFRDVPTGLHRKAIFEGESGLLGSGMLCLFEVVTFDLPAGRFSFRPSRLSHSSDVTAAKPAADPTLFLGS
jgi:hypothetical protein